QDWGGLIGLRLLAENTERFASATAANTFLPTGDQPLGEAFMSWQQQSQIMDPFPVGKILQFATTTELPGEVVAAYDAPFPDENYKAGARVFPLLVPTRPDDPAAPANRAAWAKLGELELPFLTLFSDQDPIMSGVEKYLQAHIPGAKGQAHSTIIGGGHFLQEDRPAEIVAAVVEFLG
ncbi:MAG: alpha/beta fold hydrolase, partial [Bacteroidota bacterium]